MIALETRLHHWELREPFATARDCITDLAVLRLELTASDGAQGRAEAAGVDYDGETATHLAAQLQSIAGELHDQIDGAQLLELLPAGGARNALDCALWDLRAKQTGVPAAAAAGFEALHPVTTAFTIGLGSESDTRRRAREAERYPILKLKVDAERHIDVVRIVREARPAARLLVDANQAWSRSLLERLLPPLQHLGVELIEQPVARGEDGSLDGLASAVPLAADESCTDRRSLAALRGRYQYINIKLDKCGGLTEALAMVAEANRQALGLMVGNMCGSSLAMAPAFLIAQRCRYVDLDGPLLQRLDDSPAIRYEGACMYPPLPALWG
ncbi:MAG TPA: dipeptide epimerase [Steroidobacteraceae bacterium]|nr:dipeptide epimerase [Steroidobacteraceae bacterium]